MGYTHYWYVRRDTPHERLLEASHRIIRVVEAATVPLAGWAGDLGTEPELEPDHVRFNGVEEDAHETFCWPPDLGDRQEYLGERARDTAFTFCKTASKPYDVVVVACLVAAQDVMGEYMELSSDASDPQEFFGLEVSEGWQLVNGMLGHPTSVGHGENAAQLYERVFGELPPIPDCFKETSAA